MWHLKQMHLKDKIINSRYLNILLSLLQHITVNIITYYYYNYSTQTSNETQFFLIRIVLKMCCEER